MTPWHLFVEIVAYGLAVGLAFFVLLFFAGVILSVFLGIAALFGWIHGSRQ